MTNEVMAEGLSAAALRSVEEIRAQFPGLRTSEIVLDNAGGSQVPGVVIDRIRDHYLNNYVQLGADYAASRRATKTVIDAHRFIRLIFGGDGDGEVILGPSTSSLLNTLAQSYARIPVGERNEIIVSQMNHESNIGAWVRLQERGYIVRFWNVDPAQLTTPLHELESMLTAKTLLVALPHVSNIFGAVEDVRRACQMARDVGARTVLDSVAYAPHRPLDAPSLGADWCVYSTYKVYGPHMAALYGTHEALADVEGPNHFFIPREALPTKFELGGVSHEGCAGLMGLWSYLAWLAGASPEAEPTREVVVTAFEQMSALELPLQRRLLDWLGSRPDVTILGPASAGTERVPTISFRAAGRSSREVAQRLNGLGLGVRFGHFYSWRLLAGLGIEPNDGVIRASLVHYNTPEEVDRLIEALEAELKR